MRDTLDTPLHLYEVLEEEYLSLYGQLSQEEEIKLQDREVTAKLDWRFHKGHIKAPARLAEKLKRADSSQCLQNVPADLRGRLLECPADEESLRGELNRLLEVDIYDEEAFKHETLKHSTRKLIRLYSQAERKPPGVREHINRLLLEEVYPDELEKISDIRLAAIFQRLHRQQPTALCLSGGGIRSGTFALGLLQGLARHNLLKQFDYLSTVSGGGYIGSWLTAWIHRHPKGLDGVTEDLKNVEPESKIDPDPPAVRHLRDYSNFITPKVGLLTADTWSFVAIYLRNLLLNWIVIIPLLLAVLALPRLNVSLLLAHPGRPAEWVVTLFGWVSPPFGVRHIFLAIGFIMGALALSYVAVNRPGISEQLKDRSPFWRKRTDQDGFLRYCLLPALGAAICLMTYIAWSLDLDPMRPRLWIYVLFGIGLAVAASLGYLVALKRHRPSNLKEFTKWEVVTFVLLVGVISIGGTLLARGATTFIGDPIVATPDESWMTELYACFAVPLILTLVLVVTVLFVAVSSRIEQIGDEDREWWSRFSAWVLIATLAWGAINVLVIFGPLLLFEMPRLMASVGGISGLIALLAGLSSESPPNEERETKGGWRSILGNNILPLVALAFLFVFLILLSLGTSLLIQVIANSTPLNPFADYRGSADFPVDAQGHMRLIHYPALWFVGAFVAVMTLAGIALAGVIDLNKFSLHGGYRNRLIRAYLGASRSKNERRPNPFTGFDPGDNIRMHELRQKLFHPSDFKDLKSLVIKLQEEGAGETEAQKRVSAFLKSKLDSATSQLVDAYNENVPVSTQLETALIEDLNRVLEGSALYQGETLADLPQALVIQASEKALTQSRRGDYPLFLNRFFLEQAYPKEIKSHYPPPPYRLLHVVNMALNLVGGKNLAWQQRKAEPFAVTPLHAGCFRLGYRRSKDYGGKDGISIGTAAAVSGAAASSNMGYYTSSPLISMVMTLFNVRLGWWLGNPGPAGNDTFDQGAPRLSIKPVIQEALGLTDDTRGYVYLSDGGHFENLALYEMVLRRCHVIVVSDGSQDQNYEFSDLGNAVRKIRIDLGIPIEFEDVPIYSRVPENGQGRYCAFGRIRYKCVDGQNVKDGVLIYIKPAVYGSEPQDVLQYKRSSGAFPHQSTGDQFFNEPQLESYRMLGSHIMDQISGDDLEELSIDQFVSRSYKNYKTPDTPTASPLELKWMEEWLQKHH